MKNPALALAFALLALPALASPVQADNSDARILVHLASPTTKNQCTAPQSQPPCSQAVTSGQLYPAAYFAYVLVGEGDEFKGLAGVQFGVEYDGAPHSGVDILGWTLCATLNFYLPGWPDDGTGNLVTWDPDNNCQRYEPSGFGTGVVANAGYFYVAAYSADDLRIVPRPVDGLAKVADCEAFEYPLTTEALGYARFSAGATSPGFNPCSGSPPPPIACTIFGASNVSRQSVGIHYSVTASQPGATFSWSITGEGSIVGPTNGSGVQVTAGDPGTFELQVIVSQGGNTAQCSRTVTVSTTPACAISGLGKVLQGTGGHSYTITNSSPGAAYEWSIEGNGSLSSPPTGTSVTVTAGEPGTFTLTVDVTEDGFTGSCAKVVMVSGEANCVISGSANILEGSSGNIYTASTVPEATSYLWSLTGNGVINGSATNPSVSVTAGTSGAFTLSLSFSGDGLEAQCQKVVVVSETSSPTCGISGVNEVLEGVSNIQFHGSSSYTGVGYTWSIMGNGVITTATNTSVIRVTAGTVGLFTLRLIITSGGVSDTCEKTVIVSPTPESAPGYNNNAKVEIHLLPPATQNACTRPEALPECNDVIQHGTLHPEKYFAYVVLNDGYTNGALLSGIGSIDFGISYNTVSSAGVEIFDWVSCGDTELPSANWPEPGSGNRVGWTTDHCQRTEPGGVGTGAVLTAGYFYMAAYNSDVLAIVSPPFGPVAVNDCQGHLSVIEGPGVEHSPSHLGYAGFGNEPGYSPCSILVPVVRTTWSGIKALFR